MRLTTNHIGPAGDTHIEPANHRTLAPDYILYGLANQKTIAIAPDTHAITFNPGPKWRDMGIPFAPPVLKDFGSESECEPGSVGTIKFHDSLTIIPLGNSRKFLCRIKGEASRE